MLASKPAIAIALCLQGCAALVEEAWDERPSHAPMPAYHLVVSDAVIESACGHVPFGYVYGCAIRIASEPLCLIYTRAHPAEWVMAHERRHCDGWDHHQVALKP